MGGANFIRLSHPDTPFSSPAICNCFPRKWKFLLFKSVHSFRVSLGLEDYRVAKPKVFKVAVHKNLEYKLPSVMDKMEPRRSILRLIGVNLIFGNACTVLAAPVQEMQEPDVIRTLKLGNGVRIQDILEGEGKEAQEGDLVEFNYVCRRSNGYFVHSTVDQFSGESAPVVLPLDDMQMIKGLKSVLIGMRAGGKRRALVPPSVGYISENLQPIPEEFGPRRSLLSHAKEPLVFEVQLLKVL